MTKPTRSTMRTPTRHTRPRTPLLCAFLFFAAVTISAQHAAAQSGEIDAAVTYAADHANSTASSGFWMQGGGAEVAGQLGKGFAAVANVSGYHLAPNSSTLPLNLVVPVFGPRYAWSRLSTHSRQVSLFGQALAGEAFGFSSTFPAGSATVSSAAGLALQIGGGVDIGVSKHIAIRAVEADWLRTALPNATTSVQNNLRLAGGIVLLFHSRR